MTTLHEYYEMLDSFDWFYQMSDDPAVYAKRNSQLEAFRKMSGHSPEHAKLWSSFIDYRWQCLAGANPDKPSPPAQ